MHAAYVVGGGRQARGAVRRHGAQQRRDRMLRSMLSIIDASGWRPALSHRPHAMTSVSVFTATSSNARLPAYGNVMALPFLCVKRGAGCGGCRVHLAITHAWSRAVVFGDAWRRWRSHLVHINRQVHRCIKGRRQPIEVKLEPLWLMLRCVTLSSQSADRT